MPGLPAYSPPAFELEHVCVERDGRTLLNDVSLCLPSGGFTALIGPSGAGKTTLLRLLNRLDETTSGKVKHLGQAITTYPVRPLRRRVGFVFQTPVMFAGTVAENLSVADTLKEKISSDISTSLNTRIHDLLSLSGLDPSYATRNAVDLSGGEKQRVALARALMTDPQVLLLDEPTAALDPEVADCLLQTLKQLNKTTGVTLVMVTHRLREARNAASHVVMLEAGRVVEAGPAQSIMNNALEARTRAYLNVGEEGERHAA